jgi:PAS domain S-box-containing protein
MSSSVSLKNQLRFLLRVRGISASELARRAGVPKQTISVWLHGIIPKSIPQLRRVADALNVSLDDLCYGETAAPPRAPAGDPATARGAPLPGREAVDALELFRVLLPSGFQCDLSPNWEAAMGWPLADLTSRTVLEFVHFADRQRAWLQMTRNFQGIPTVNFDNRFLCRSGRIRWLRWNAVASLEQARCYCVARDVSADYPPEADLPSRMPVTTLVEDAVETVHRTQGAGAFTFRVQAVPSSMQVECRPARISMGILALVNECAALAARAGRQRLIEVRVREDRRKLQFDLAIPGSTESPLLRLSRLAFQEHGGDVATVPAPTGVRLVATLPRIP